MHQCTALGCMNVASRDVKVGYLSHRHNNSNILVGTIPCVFYDLIVIYWAGREKERERMEERKERAEECKG